MNENIGETIKRQYFEMDDEKVIYPSSTGKRFLARLLDILFINIIPLILILSYTLSLDSNTQFGEINSYEPLMISAWIFSIIFILALFIGYPLLNKKNFGQTFGKKLIGVTPLFLNSKNKYFYVLKRELPLAILFIIPYIFYLMTGYDANLVYIVYSSNLDNGINPEGFNIFVNEIWGVNNYIQSVSLINYWYSLFKFIMLLVLFITILANDQRRGILDKFSDIVIVDLKTIGLKADAEFRYQQMIGMYKQQQDSMQQSVPDQQSANTTIPTQEDKEIIINDDSKTNITEKSNSLPLPILNVDPNQTMEVDSNVKKENEKDDKVISTDKKESLKSNNNENSINYNIKTIKELKDILTKKNIKFKASANKKELIELLNSSL